MRIVVNVSDMKLSKKPGDVIVTHALGSCIGIAIHDAEACVGGILHYMLPKSTIDQESETESIYVCRYRYSLFFRNWGQKRKT